jgi:aspartate 1-decarboxylase
MQLSVLKSKIHLATITRSELLYHGSLTVDPILMEAVGLVPYEAILVSNVATGTRATTYVIPGRHGGGQIELNGAMARLGAVGDRIIVMAFAQLGPDELAGHAPWWSPSIRTIGSWSGSIIPCCRSMAHCPSWSCRTPPERGREDGLGRGFRLPGALERPQIPAKRPTTGIRQQYRSLLLPKED